jgi:CMP-N,N'-diacetyllegionaminic acid synthase
MKILALIPARSGSKGIKGKNIKLFNGKPLIHWSINLAKKCKHITRVICSTDSFDIAKIANESGAEIPFLRPKKISQDLSTDFDFIHHCLKYLYENETYKPDLIIQLRPTYPTRNLEILNKSIELFKKNYDNYDSLRTVIKNEKSPFKMYIINKHNLQPLFKTINNIKEPYNKCRQELPITYLHNGYIDIMKYDTIMKLNSVTGDKIYPFIMNKNEYHDIDTLEDWEKAENSIKKL